MEYPEIKGKKVIAFDLDDTLSKSKLPIDEEMDKLLSELLKIKEVVVVSGGSFVQIDKQVMSQLTSQDNLQHLHVFPTNGTSYYKWDNGWKEVYAENLEEYDKDRIRQALDEALKETNFDFGESWGDRVEDRKTQITFSGLGQNAPLDRKTVWDPSGSRRKLIVSALHRRLPGFEIHVAGKTSIDITAKGSSKAHAMEKMFEFLHVTKDEAIFVGDSVSPEGNDYPVLNAGVMLFGIKGPEETKAFIRHILTA